MSISKKVHDKKTLATYRAFAQELREWFGCTLDPDTLQLKEDGDPLERPDWKWQMKSKRISGYGKAYGSASRPKDLKAAMKIQCKNGEFIAVHDAPLPVCPVCETPFIVKEHRGYYDTIKFFEPTCDCIDAEDYNPHETERGSYA